MIVNASKARTCWKKDILEVQRSNKLLLYHSETNYSDNWIAYDILYDN